jgi:pullulanase
MRRPSLLLVLLAATFALADGSSVDVSVDVPAWTRGNVYLAVSVPVNGKPAWAPDGVPLTRGEDGRWHGSVPASAGSPIEAKVTLGTWSSVEKGPALEDLGNRSLAAGSPVTAHVFHWGGDEIPNARNGRLVDLGDFTPPELGTPRKVTAYLPEGYDDPANANRRYPVLYALDGQNLFARDPSRSFGGTTWAVDHAIDATKAAGSEPAIVIAIDNTNERMDEYTPSFDPTEDGGGKLAQLTSFLLGELKSTVDTLYRTRPGPADTAIMGSSLGGLAALWIGWEHSDKVGHVLALSPSFWWNFEETKDMIAKSSSKPPLEVWIDMGTAEGSEETIPDARRVVEALLGKGFQFDKDLRYAEWDGARHDEASWADRLPRVLQAGLHFPAESEGLPLPATTPETPAAKLPATIRGARGDAATAPARSDGFVSPLRKLLDERVAEGAKPAAEEATKR